MLLTKVVSMSTGEILHCTVFKISRIPFRSNSESTESEQVLEKYRVEFARMLTEIHQWSISKFSNVENVSLEIVWDAHEVKNQTYKADIDLYVVIRNICQTPELAQASNNTLSRIVRDMLTTLSYEFVECDVDDFEKKVGISHDQCISIVKSESVEASNVPFLDAIYTFGCIPDATTDFNALVKSISDAPGTTVHFQLLMSAMKEDQRAVLTDYLQKASMASRGVMARGIGQISYLQAENIQKLFQPYYDQRVGPFFKFNIIVRGNNNFTDGVATQVVGQLNSNPNNPVRFDKIRTDDSLFHDRIWFSPWRVSISVRRNRLSNRLVTAGGEVNEVFRSLSEIIMVSEAVEFFRLPIGSDDVRSGLNINESSSSVHRYGDGVVGTSEVTLGNLVSSRERTIGLMLEDLTKHMFVCGMPGSGKSSFSIGMLDKLWNTYNIPFIVIEPAKNEYRALIDRIPNLQVFTPGKEFISPLVMNPFVPPDNVRLSSYKRTLKTAFSAAVTMATPLDRIFEETISNCYSDHGWSDYHVCGDGGRVFNIVEFVKCFRQTFAEIGYVGEANNIGRAGEVRLKALSNLFDCYGTVPISDLLKNPTIIELAAVENSEEKSLFIALILLSVLSYVNANYKGDGKLKNIILLEEAHVLLDQNSNDNEKADPSAIAQNLVKRMLAESRAYGLGMIIADQSPRKVGLDIVALTDIKIAFRLVERSDREIIGDSMAMDESQLGRLPKLHPGEAFTFYSRLDAPEEISMCDYRAENGIRVWISDAELTERVSYWSKHPELTCPYPECLMSNLCAGGCNYMIRTISKDLARKLFKSTVYNTHDKTILAEAARSIPGAIEAETFGMENYERCVFCTKVQYWRRVCYDSKYNISDKFKNRMIVGGVNSE